MVTGCLPATIVQQLYIAFQWWLAITSRVLRCFVATLRLLRTQHCSIKPQSGFCNRWRIVHPTSPNKPSTSIDVPSPNSLCTFTSIPSCLFVGTLALYLFQRHYRHLHGSVVHYCVKRKGFSPPLPHYYNELLLKASASRGPSWSFSWSLNSERNCGIVIILMLPKESSFLCRIQTQILNRIVIGLRTYQRRQRRDPMDKFRIWGVFRRWQTNVSSFYPEWNSGI